MMKKAVVKGARKNRKCPNKIVSRDAARSRRGQQNDGYSELASQLPLPLSICSQLDRLCVMRLVNSYIKMKQLMESMTKQDISKIASLNVHDSQLFDKALLEALDGFVFVVTTDGQCLYVSDNVSHYMGLSQIEVCGNSIYKYVHPCDHEELANQLGGQIPLEDMEIFDGLFCSDSVFTMSNLLKGGSKRKQDTDNPYKSFSLRMKSTLTSRGKSVNLKASTYRVVHCTGCMKMKTTVSEDGTEQTTPHFMVAIGVPLMVASNFEVPLDRSTFTSHHSLDMKILSCDDKVQNLLGYSPVELAGKSWYNFQHGCDLDTALACHKTLLTKGQSVSKYYRFLVRDGGWVWLQTKANIVYDSKTCQPQFILCINYLLGGTEWKDHVLANEQVNPVPLPSALVLLNGAKETTKTKHNKRKNTSIVIEERNKVLKSTTNQKQAIIGIQTKADAKLSDCSLKDFPCTGKKTGIDVTPVKPQEKKLDVDCESLNFQDCLPVVWDVSENLATPEETREQYTFTDTPPVSPASEISCIPAVTSPAQDERMQSPEKSEHDLKELPRELKENFNERAPFIPLPDDDALPEIENELLKEIPFVDLPMSPFSWLLDDDISVGESSLDASLFEPTPDKMNIPYAGKTTFDANYLSSEGMCLPVVTQFDTDVNAPVEMNCLLGGMDLFRELELENPP